METTKIIYSVKDESAVDSSTVTRWFKKFCTVGKSLDDQTRSGRPKTATEANLASSIQRVSVELCIFSPVGFVIFMSSAKVLRAAELCLMLPNYSKNSTHPTFKVGPRNQRCPTYPDKAK